MLPLSIALLISAVHAQVPIVPSPRWGQAFALLESYLYVQGGKHNPDGSQTYFSSPEFNELIFLPLTDSFSVDSPPWSLLSSSDNSSTSQGPAVAWHTLSAYNSSSLLIFGGEPATTVALPTQPDSAWILNAYNRVAPQFLHEPLSWDGEPVRREHHAAISTTSGNVYIFGGEKVDGSGTVPDTDEFNPVAGSFSSVSTDNAPPALTGNAAVVLPDSTVVVFGGVSSGSVVSMNTFWIYDTTTNSWSSRTSSSSNAPSGRRAFAYTLLDDHSTILIHGGADAVLQTSYGDGWQYDMNADMWTHIPALDEIGLRRDHLAVAFAGQVLFAFGYETNNPANASILCYNPSSQSWQPSYTPPPTTATTSFTIPVATQTLTTNSAPTGTGTSGSTGTGTGAGTGTGTGKATGTGTNTASGGDPSSTGGSNPSGPNGAGSTRKTTTIAVGAVVALLALVAAGAGVIWYMRRQERHRWAAGGVGGVFSPLNDEDPNGSRPSAATMVDAAPENGVGGAVGTIGSALGWVTGALGLGAVAATRRDHQERRDMLAEEDEREFGWYDNDGDSSRLRNTGGSTWSLLSALRPKARRQGSAASGLSFNSLSRGGSLLGHGHGESEKDPYRDELYAAGAAGAAAVAGASRPKYGHRQTSQASIQSNLGGYVDPFADPIVEPDLTNTLLAVRGRALSPVTEASRSSTEGGQSLTPFDSFSKSSSFGPFSSSSHQNSPGFPTGTSSSSIVGLAGTPPRRPSSILDMQPQESQASVRRSDTWWGRFANRSLLDRRSSGGASTSRRQPDIRDPNPLPQRLGFVKEETASVMRERSDGSDTSQAGAVPYKRTGHGKSMSSLQTQRTADSAAIERMGNVDVALRGNRQSASTSTRGSGGTTTRESSMAESTHRMSWRPEGDDNAEELATSPVAMAPASNFTLPDSPPPAARKDVPPPPPARPALSTAGSSGSSSNSVADRVKAYERRASQDVTPASPRTKSGNYGLVTRPSLFVANPDTRHAGEDSTDSRF